MIEELERITGIPWRPMMNGVYYLAWLGPVRLEVWPTPPDKATVCLYCEAISKSGDGWGGAMGRALDAVVGPCARVIARLSTAGADWRGLQERDQASRAQKE